MPLETWGSWSENNTPNAISERLAELAGCLMDAHIGLANLVAYNTEATADHEIARLVVQAEDMRKEMMRLAVEYERRNERKRS